MTPTQIQLVQSTWRQMQPIQAAAADLFYARLFELAPDVRRLFVRDIHVQGAMLMRMLDSIVAQLDEPATLLASARQLARRHVGYGVRPEHYASVGTALVWTLEQGLGEAFTVPVRQAWMAAYGALDSAMHAVAVSSPPQGTFTSAPGSPAPH